MRVLANAVLSTDMSSKLREVLLDQGSLGHRQWIGCKYARHAHSVKKRYIMVCLSDYRQRLQGSVKLRSAPTYIAWPNNSSCPVGHHWIIVS